MLEQEERRATKQKKEMKYKNILKEFHLTRRIQAAGFALPGFAGGLASQIDAACGRSALRAGDPALGIPCWGSRVGDPVLGIPCWGSPVGVPSPRPKEMPSNPSVGAPAREPQNGIPNTGSPARDPQRGERCGRRPQLFAKPSPRRSRGG